MSSSRSLLTDPDSRDALVFAAQARAAWSSSITAPAFPSPKERRKMFEDFKFSGFNMTQPLLRPHRRFFLLRGYFQQLLRCGGELREREDLQTLVWAVHRLCQLGATPALMESVEFATFLASPDQASTKLEVFRVMCHAFHRTWPRPRPRSECFACSFPLLNFLWMPSSTREIRSSFLRAHHDYLESSKVAQALRHLRAELAEDSTRRSSILDLDFTLASPCPYHQLKLGSLDVELVEELVGLLEESHRKLPTLQQASARVVLRAVGGDRSRAAGLDVTQPARDVLSPPLVPHPPAEPPCGLTPFCDDGVYPGRRSRECVSLLQDLLVLPRLYERLGDDEV